MICRLFIDDRTMASVNGHPTPAGMLSLSHPLSSSYHKVYVSVISISRMKESRIRSRQRRKTRALTLSALVEANPRTLPSLSEGTSRSITKINDATQSAAASGVTDSDRRKNLADDMQAEARAMTRAATASVYTPEMVATKYGSRPFMVDNGCLYTPFNPILYFAHLYFFG